MEIKLTNIYSNYVNLSRLITNCEENFLSAYATLNDVQNCWHDNDTKKFLDLIQKEKKFAINTCDELRNLANLYRYMLDEYKDIGKRVFYEQKNYSSLNYKFESCIELSQSILKKYQDLNVNYNNYDAYLIVDNKEKYGYVVKQLSESIYNIKSKAEQIMAIEAKVKEILSKFDIELIKESDINEFLQ